MRLVVIAAVYFAVTGVAHAKVTTTCYAGTDELADAQFRMVLVHEVDPGAHQIRNHSWRSNAPRRVFDASLAVSPDGRAFEYRARGLRGAGSLVGAPWAWTGSHSETPAFGGTLIADARFVGTVLKTATRFEQRGRVRWHAYGELVEFECRELERRRAALDDAAPDAVRSCFEGTQTLHGDKSPVVVEQIVETKRIVYVVATPRLDNRTEIVIDGTAITANNGHAWRGAGTIEGAPGAWTSYTYRARLDGQEVTTTGVIGGTRIRRVDAKAGESTAMASLDAVAFDCKHLEARLATLTISP